MKTHSLTLISLAISIITNAQSPKEVIARILQAQQNIHSAAYRVTRQDTLVTNEVRTLSGDVCMDGLKFRVHQDGKDNIRIFDGKEGFDLYISDRRYKLYEKPSGGFFYNDGTQLIIKDLIKIDTSRAIRISLNNSSNGYDLIFYYADIAAYDVTQRRKTVTISRTTWLPTAVREHQVTLGRVQDLYYQISNLQINAPLDIDFSGYTLQTTTSPMVQINNPAIITAFPFKLKSFDGSDISLKDAKDKVVLLDFWEVWCGPCIESLPKVEALYQKFHSKGLEVYGITHDSAQITPARKLVGKFRLTFPTLIGTSETKTKYAINSLPAYILIDQQGRVVMTTQGYSTIMEDNIRKLLSK